MSTNSNESNDSASPAGSGTSLVPKPGFVIPFNEDEAKNALVEARGDIFVAAQMLGVTALRLTRAIQVSTVLQAAIDEINSTPANKGLTDTQIHQAIDQRLGVYRVAGLDALHDLATMEIDKENSANNQVKLAAAARLAGADVGGASSGDMGEIFRELRQEYETHAPRLRVVRERTTTTVEMVPQHDPVVISQEPQK